jgi:phosphatidylserine/phosphatidylglycerophosphate/cardiolipin synthase-like enzyme
MKFKLLIKFFIFSQSILFSGQIKILFTPYKKTYIEFKKLLGCANKSIYISSFSVNPSFLNFLEKKNIDVRIISDYGNIKNFKFKNFEGKGIFHSKFIIIDENIVIITSANLSEEHFYKNHNNLVIIENNEIAKYLVKKFNSLWYNCEFTNVFFSEDKNIEIWFSPENNCEELIRREIKNTKESIIFATYIFTNRELADELIKKTYEKVNVSGIMESYNIKPYSVFYLLLSYGCNVRKSCMSGFLHDKFFIFDKKRIITGSFNPTKSAKNNIELTLFINDEKIAEEFYNEWKRLYIFKSIVEKF